jgi:hypothetical protein
MTLQPGIRNSTPLDILNHACEFGIIIALDGDNLVATVPFDLEHDIKDNVLESIKDHKPDIIAYLHSLESVSQQIEALYEQIKHYHTPTGLIFWYGGRSGYPNDLLVPDEYSRRVKNCAESGDPLRMQAAIHAMNRTLGLKYP